MLPAARIDTYFVVRGDVLTVPADMRSHVLDSPALLLKLFNLARSRRAGIDPDLLEDIHRHADQLSDEAFRAPEVGEAFLAILAGPGTAQDAWTRCTEPTSSKNWCRPLLECVG